VNQVKFNTHCYEWFCAIGIWLFYGSVIYGDLRLFYGADVNIHDPAQMPRNDLGVSSRPQPYSLIILC